MLLGFFFPYKGEALAAEIILIFILAGLQAVRIFFGMFYNYTVFLVMFKDDCDGHLSPSAYI